MIRYFSDRNNTTNIEHFCTKHSKIMPIWTDIGGKKYRCECEITDEHLRSIIAFLEEKLWSLPFPMFNGEMAQYYAEQAWRSEHEELSSELYLFRGIASRRGIK